MEEAAAGLALGLSEPPKPCCVLRASAPLHPARPWWRQNLLPPSLPSGCPPLPLLGQVPSPPQPDVFLHQPMSEGPSALTLGWMLAQPLLRREETWGFVCFAKLWAAAGPVGRGSLRPAWG